MSNTPNWIGNRKWLRRRYHNGRTDVLTHHNIPDAKKSMGINIYLVAMYIPLSRIYQSQLGRTQDWVASFGITFEQWDLDLCNQKFHQFRLDRLWNIQSRTRRRSCCFRRLWYPEDIAVDLFVCFPRSSSSRQSQLRQWGKYLSIHLYIRAQRASLKLSTNVSTFLNSFFPCVLLITEYLFDHMHCTYPGNLLNI